METEPNLRAKKPQSDVPGSIDGTCRTSDSRINGAEAPMLNARIGLNSLPEAS